MKTPLSHCCYGKQTSISSIQKLVISFILIFSLQFSLCITDVLGQADDSTAYIEFPRAIVVEVAPGEDAYFRINYHVSKPLVSDSIKEMVLNAAPDIISNMPSTYFKLFPPVIRIPVSVDSAERFMKEYIGIIHVPQAFDRDTTFLLDLAFAVDNVNPDVKLNHSHTVIQVKYVLKNKGSVDGVSVALGANFDLADGAKINSFYGRMSFLDHNIIHVKNRNQDTDNNFFRTVGRAIGVYAGAYQNKYVTSKSESVQEEFYYRKNILNSDSLEVKHVLASENQKTETNNYGLILTIPFKVSEKSTPKKTRFISMTFLDFELVFRRSTIDYEYKYTDSSVNVIHRDATLEGSLVRTRTVIDYVDNYWGIACFQYTMSGVNYNFFLKANPYGLYWNNLERKMRPSYSYYFGVTERGMGIRIGGEIKGVYGVDKPFFNFFITKSFDLAKFGNALKGGE